MMKTLDEESVPAPVLAVPVPVLVLDEEETIEDLSAKICAFQQGLGEESALYSPGLTGGGVPAARRQYRGPAGDRVCRASRF